jgi:hypothetical protein
MSNFCIGARVWHSDKQQSFTVGATAVVSGQILKFSSGLLVTAADNDQQGLFMIALQNAAAGAQCVVSLDADTIFDLYYSGTATPAVGAAYGISDGKTMDPDNTTQKLVTVLEMLDATAQYVCVKFYQKTA